MLFIILMGVFLVLFVTNPMFRSGVLHPIRTLTWFIHDVYDYIKYKRYNEFNGYGKIQNYIASTSQAFGCGKTLTMVSEVRRIYKLYNNKKVYDYDRQIFVTQHIRVISNVSFTDIPYVPFKSINQFAKIEEYYKKPCFPYEEAFQPQDIIIFAVDEIGHVFNSRDFKTNFSTETLTRMLQVRKNKVLWIGTSQRWGLVDKIIRETSSTVTTCRKWWRFILLQDFDAWDLENAKSYEMLKPLKTSVWFALDRDYKSYDTNQLVEDINKRVDDRDFIQTETILANAGVPTSSDLDIVKRTHLKGMKKVLKH